MITVITEIIFKKDKNGSSKDMNIIRSITEERRQDNRSEEKDCEHEHIFVTVRHEFEKKIDNFTSINQ